ncbi:MAG TPA: hypothetical protein VEI04_06385 [Syntrophobacteria bacterium]|nr:hypothetical protein [Syntrophobacteria bacterium]
MARQKPTRKPDKGQSLSQEEQVQLQMLLDRVAVQDPGGESLKQFLASLALVLERSPGVALAFIEALGSAPTPVALKVLEAVQDVPAVKPIRRAVKAALYRLGRHGLALARRNEGASPRVLIPRPADRRAEAWAGWPDGSGDRGVILTVPDAGPAYLLVMAVLNSTTGFRDLQVNQTTRKGVRALVAELAGGGPSGLRPIPVTHLAYLLAEAARVQEEQNQPLPEGADLVHRFLSSWVALPPTRAHIYEVLDRDEIAADSILLRASGSLLDLPPMTSWQLPQELALPLAEKVKGLGESRLVLSRASQFERVDQLMREAAAELFTPALRQHYRRLLEEAALLFWEEHRIQEAKRALAAANDLEREVGRLTENTFVLGLVKRALGDAIKDLEGEEGTPEQTRTTESGLILPGR